MALHKAHLLESTALQLQEGLCAGAFSSLQLVNACLDQMKRHDVYLHAVISTPFRKQILDKAQVLDQERAAGNVRGPFHGIPVLVKASDESHSEVVCPDGV